MAKPYISKGTVGIDVGCREGGFSAQMEQDFKHIFAFDFRNRSRNLIGMLKILQSLPTQFVVSVSKMVIRSLPATKLVGSKMEAM